MCIYVYRYALVYTGLYMRMYIYIWEYVLLCTGVSSIYRMIYTDMKIHMCLHISANTSVHGSRAIRAPGKELHLSLPGTYSSRNPAGAQPVIRATPV